jgi:hypothetical protein
MNPRVRDRATALLLTWLLWLAVPGYAQTPAGTITGRVTNARTGEPLPFTNVFLPNTTIGTATDKDGRFVLGNLPLGTVEVAASHLGFKLYRRTLRFATAEPQVLDIALLPAAVSLATVEVKAKGRGKLHARYRQFRREFLGTSPFARNCEIRNPEVLSFDTEKVGVLKASAAEPLHIVNRALGYELLFYLEVFEVTRDVTKFLGVPKFTLLEPRNPAERALWEKNRKTAYYASTRYLLRLLVEGRWEEAGFLVVEVNNPAAMTSPLLYPYIGRGFSYLDPAAIVRPGRLPFERGLGLYNNLEVFNLKKYNFYSPYRDVHYDHSRVIIKQTPLEVTTDGWLYNPTSIVVTGYLAKDRVATMLPREYGPEGDNPLSPIDGMLANAPRIPLLDTLAARLRKLPRQQLYLHHDKRYYWSGNAVQFSAYLTDAVTGDLYPDDQLLNAELVSPAGKRVGHVRLKAGAGRAVGQLLLPDTAATGVYRLRAYTNWMRQVPGSYLYDQPLVVYNARNPGFVVPDGAAGTPTAGRPVQARFFPEGGQLVGGLACHAAIRVTGADGSGVAAKGRIFDDLNQEAATFATDDGGLGGVLFTPAPGRTYRAEVFGAAPGTFFDLPPVRETGVALRVDYRGPAGVNVRVERTADLAEDTLLLVVQSRRMLVHTARVPLRGGFAELSIPEAKLPPGVNRLVLLDRQGTPYAGRLVFREGTPPPLRVRVDARPAGVGPREKMQLQLSVTDSTGNPVPGDFSVSVTDARQQKADDAGNNILFNRLLTAELPQFVDAPARYLAPADAAGRQRTDLLMLTQGAGWPDWTGLLQKAPPVPRIEDYFLTVSGKVTDPRGKKALPNCRVIMLSVDSSYQNNHQTYTDSTGRFRFPRLDFSDTIRVNFLTFNAQGKTVPALVTLDSLPSPGNLAAPYPSFLLARYRPDAQENHRTQVARAGLELDKVQQLKEVVVKGRRKREPTEAEKRFSLNSMADYVLNVSQDGFTYPSIYHMLARVPGVQVIYSSDGSGAVVRIRGFNSLGARSFAQTTEGGLSSMATGAGNSEGGGPLFLIDDNPVMGEANMILSTISPGEVSRIEVTKGVGGAAYGARGANGVIAIYLKTFADYDREAAGRAVKKYALAGYITPKPVPMPDYSREESQKTARDDREVLYWNPLLKTDEAGNATFELYNSDQARTFQVVVEGITATGQPVSFTGTIGQ